MMFKTFPIDVWRKVATSGIFLDENWAYHHTSQMGKHPFTGDDSYKMGQVFENIRDFVTADIAEDVLKTDLLYYDSAYHRIQYIENYDNGLLPHKEILTTDSQWEP